MRTESLRTTNANEDLGKIRYGVVRDVAAKDRNHAQNTRVTDEVDRSQIRKKPEPLKLEARTFQLELYRRAKTQNTIAVLDTGSGKTFIAALIIKDVLSTEIEARQSAIASGISRKSKVAFFIVDKVALAIQQAEFLQRTCAGRIGLLYGALGVDNFSKAQWASVFQQHDLIVLTADILKDCLARGLFSMENINLLVYDEAHHCQNSHAYALIQDMYHKVLKQFRPKVFGMTASPVGSKQRPEAVANELERRLDATICTPDPDSSLSEFVVRPEEYLCFYAKIDLSKQIVNPLFGELEGLLVPFKSTQRLLNNARYCAQTMGQWAAGIIFKRLLDDFGWRLEAKSKHDNSKSLRNEWKVIKLAKEKLEQQYVQPSAAEVQNSLTPKVSELLTMLRDIYQEALDKGEPEPVVIVFCERRSTAYLLMILVNEIIKSTFPVTFKSSLFVGHGSSEEGDISMPMHRQALVMNSFRKGTEINCLWATSVVEEGIDIPACNVIIRFEPVFSFIRYVQSRGRARKAGSRYITMLEAGDVQSLAQHQLVKDSEEVIKNICRSLRKDRFVHGEELTEDDTPAETSHHLPSFAAVSVVQHYCRSLPSDEFVSIKPDFRLEEIGSGFRVTCHLPPISEIPPVCGGIQPNKRLAHVDAAQCTVQELIARDLIDDVYNPKYHHTDDSSIEETGEFEVDCRTRKAWTFRGSRFWTQGVPTRYFLTKVHTDRTGLTKFADLLLVTKKPLPKLPLLPFYHRDDSFSIACSNFEESIAIAPEQLSILTEFTRRLLKVMINKKFVGSSAEFPYLMGIFSGVDDVEKAIDWPEVEYSHWDNHSALNAESLSAGIPDAIVKEKHQGTYYFANKVNWDLNPDSTLPNQKPNVHDVPGEVVLIKTRTERAFPTIEQAKPNQPIIEVTHLHRVLNFLAPPAKAKARHANTEPVVYSTPKVSYLVPQWTHIVNMRASVVATAFLIPALMTRIESYLLAQELNTAMSTEIDLSLLVDAITARQANHACDYERLEFIGDAYLKLISTLAVYLEFPTYHEGLLTGQRTAILNNKNLTRQAIKRKFKAAWRPEFLLVEGEEKLPEKLHTLGMKQIADVVEALIGAAVYHGGFDVGLKAAVALGVETFGLNSWDDARRKYKEPRFLTTKRCVTGQTEIEEAFEYKFQNNGYLDQAMRHGSMPISVRDPVPSYQRLEFIGDAVLEIEVCFWLFRKYLHYDPDRLTKMKSHLVRNKSLGCICEALGIHKFMNHFNGGVMMAMSNYSQELAYLKARSSKSDYYSDCEPPKFMSDILESTMGAIFLDNGFQTEPIRRIFHKCFLPRLDPDIDFSTKKPVMQVLTHLLQRFGCEQSCIRKNEIIEHSSLDYKIAHKFTQPKRLVTLSLFIHEHEICKVESHSHGLAKLKLGEEALTILKGHGEDQEESGLILKKLCDCPPRAKNPEKKLDDDEFDF